MINVGGLPLPQGWNWNNNNNGNDHDGWFRLPKNWPTNTVHIITTAATVHAGLSLHRRLSPLIHSSLKGIINERSRHLNQLDFGEWSKDAILCFFDGHPSRKETRNDRPSSTKMLIGSIFRQGRWTNVLLAINVLAFVAQLSTQGKLMLYGAKINSLIDKGQFWRLVTASFLHGNIGHLLVNCYSLRSIGPTVENICGTRRFLTVYFTSAVASTAMSYWLCQAPAVGASGAIFGLAGSVAVFCLRHRELFGSATQDLQHIAKVIVLNLMFGLMSRGIDNWGHLGGLLGGAAISWFIGPAWKHDFTYRDGIRVLIDRAPIKVLTQRRHHRFK